MPVVTWSLFAFLAAVSLLLTWGLALLVFRTDSARRPNRRLCYMLVMEGLAISFPVSYFLTSPGAAYAYRVVALTGLVVGPWFYLRFLSTLDTPLVKPLRTYALDRSLMALAAVSLIVLVARPGWFIVEMVDTHWFAPWAPEFGLGYRLWLDAMAVTNLFGLVAAISAFRRAPRASMARRKARAFVYAFSFRDLLLAFTFLVVYPIYETPGHARVWDVLIVTLPSVMLLVFVGLVSYGILKAQLFDIDLKIKASLKRGLITACFPAAFFVGTEVLAEVIPVTGFVLGLGASGAVALVFRPLERSVHRMVNRALPGVQSTAAYEQMRKTEVYRAAFESAFEDGSLTDKERSILERLRLRLGVDVQQAADVELVVRQDYGAMRPALATAA